MKIEAKYCWILGSVFILGYTIIAWILHSSWVSYGLNPAWWVTVLPWSFFTFATIFAIILAYKIYENSTVE